MVAISSGMNVPATLAFLALAFSSAPTHAAEATSERDVGGQFLVRATLGAGELRRSIYPRFRMELATQGAEVAKTLRLAVELYSEVRTYQRGPGEQANASYERAYTKMVEAGDCRPVSAGFREASFDCGVAKGYRTVAVRQDALGTYFTWESTATELIPDHSAFDRARSALDDLTSELIDASLQNPAKLE